jgi:hypothetical protein
MSSTRRGAPAQPGQPDPISMISEKRAMDDTHSTVARGERARAELALTADALKGLRQAALEEIVVTPPDQAVKRERLIVCAQLIEALKAALQDSVDAGEVANYRLKLAEQNLLRP